MVLIKCWSLQIASGPAASEKLIEGPNSTLPPKIKQCTHIHMQGPWRNLEGVMEKNMEKEAGGENSQLRVFKESGSPLLYLFYGK